MYKDQSTSRTRREAITKELRAKARREQTTFRTAVDSASTRETRRLNLLNERHNSVSVNRGKIQHGGESNFISKGRLVHSRSVCTSDGSEDFDEKDFFESLSSRPSRSSVPLVIQLNQLPTKYVRPKGVRRDYEFVESVQRVVAIDDDAQSTVSDFDEWESVFADVTVSPERKPYASVVAGG